ncbi:MAG: STAS domain-containing protein [Candidatus Eremiobacter antarcticus]|nr:STAS domain-containing protein [Candidatus Eremiobacteraeota bacterium]MBC5808981.1 STAS domain-containing protein [Candidatus Eremiobacteraeota bacterium]
MLARSMDFTLQVQRIAGATVVELSGEFDIYSAPRFKEMIAAYVDGGDRTFVVCLERVSYVDSSALGAVLAMKHKIEGAAGSLSLVTNQVRTLHLLDIAGINRIIPTFTSRQQALHALAPPATV